MSEPPSNNSEVGNKTYDKDDVIDLLNDDKPDKADKTDKTEGKDKIELKEDKDDDDKLELKDDKSGKKAIKKPKDDEDEDEDDEDEDEDDEDLDDDEGDEEPEEDIEITAPPRKREILEKYPKFFKEFPFFEKLMFRDRQYSELFGSFDDAKEVHRHAQVLAEFDEELKQGNIERILKSVKTHEPKAFDKVVDNYLKTLASVDKDAYFEVASNVGRQIIKEMAVEAKNSGDKELEKAALALNKFLFNSSTWVPPKPRVAESEDNKEKEEVQQEREALIRDRFEATRDDLQSRVDNTLRNTISEYIDPKGEMTAYVKKNAVRDCLARLHKTLGSDTTFRKTLDKLWENAFSTRFSRESSDRIKSAYLGRSKSVLPAVIRKARAEALKDSSPSARKAENDEDEPRREQSERRRDVTPGRPRQSTGGKMKMEKGESVLEFLSRD